MTKPRRFQNGNQQSENTKMPINEETLNQLLDVEKRKIELRMSERAYREKHIDNQALIAREQLKAQAEYLKAKPRQDRLSVITIGLIVSFVLLIVLGFLLLLIYWKETEFAKYLLVTVSHIIVGSLSYVAGKGKKQIMPPQVDETADEAQVVQ